MHLPSVFLVETELLIASRWEAIGTTPGSRAIGCPTTGRAPSTNRPGPFTLGRFLRHQLGDSVPMAEFAGFALAVMQDRPVREERT
jgi:hypothetical protein